jgi:hypothetical protein
MKRRVMGSMILLARVVGAGFILLGVLCLPQMRFLTGIGIGQVGVVLAVALGLSGIIWLVAVQVFISFFDQFLSRN